MPTPSASLNEASASADVSPTERLNVVIVYDDRQAYRRAIRMLANALWNDLGPDGVRLIPWGADELGLGAGRQRALNDAAEADVFVVSLATDATLTSSLLEYLEVSLARRRNLPTAVLALYERRHAPPPFAESVRLVAENAGIDFIQPVAVDVDVPCTLASG